MQLQSSHKGVHSYAAYSHFYSMPMNHITICISNSGRSQMVGYIPEGLEWNILLSSVYNNN